MSIFYQNKKEQLLLYTSYNNTFSTHLHKQAELIVTLEGELSLTVNHAPYHLTKGDCALVFPNQLHSLSTQENSRILLIIFDIHFCHSYRKLLQDYLPMSNVISLSSLTHHSLTATNGLLQLTEDFPRGTTIPKPVLLLAEGYLTLFLADFFTHISLQSKEISEDLELEQKLLIYLDSHYTEDLSLELLAREFGVSRFVLSRLFTEKLQTSFPNYVNSKRLELASELLTTTNLSVTEIALEAGFGSSRSFFREFGQTFGVTPGEYRRRHNP